MMMIIISAALQDVERELVLTNLKGTLNERGEVENY